MMKSHTVKIHIFDGLIDEVDPIPTGIKVIVRETETNGLENKTGVDDSGHDYIEREWEGPPPVPQTITIMVGGDGELEIVDKHPGIRVVIRNYNLDPIDPDEEINNLRHDEHGDRYSERVWKAEGVVPPEAPEGPRLITCDDKVTCPKCDTNFALAAANDGSDFDITCDCGAELHIACEWYPTMTAELKGE